MLHIHGYRVESTSRNTVARERLPRDDRLSIGVHGASRVCTRPASCRRIIDNCVGQKCAEIATLLSCGGHSRRNGNRHSPLLNLKGPEIEELVLNDVPADRASKTMHL